MYVVTWYILPVVYNNFVGFNHYLNLANFNARRQIWWQDCLILKILKDFCLAWIKVNETPDNAENQAVVSDIPSHYIPNL